MPLRSAPAATGEARGAGGDADKGCGDQDELSLTVVIATREPHETLTPLLDVLVPQVREVGGELILACGDGRPGPESEWVKYVADDDQNVLRLRQLAIKRARGRVIAICEDHALPTPGWCQAVVRAHAERPDAPVVAGCLINGTTDTVAGRANFFGFAAPFTPPMVTIERPPPFSTLSFKREAMVGDDTNPGSYESVLVPRLFEECAIAVDDRIVLVHFQDHGVRWTLQNAFVNARANYGYARDFSSRGRREVIRFIVTRLGPRQWQEAWASRSEFVRPADAVLTAAICVCTAAGALTGVLAGAGQAGDKVA